MENPQRNPQKAHVPAKALRTDYPLIDSDPHFKRVIRYARPSDYAIGAGTAAAGPALLFLMERIAPSYVGRGGFAPIMRLLRFYGFKENKREMEMDMREMVDKIKRGESPYGTSTLTPYMQGVASRNSRYSGLFLHVLPWFNIVNHDQMVLLRSTEQSQPALSFPERVEFSKPIEDELNALVELEGSGQPYGMDLKIVADAEEMLVTKELIKLDEVEVISSEVGKELKSMKPEAAGLEIVMLNMGEPGMTGIGVTATEET
ncbi:hypothetical protein GP486_000318 [Trichoglossum hirsutum]|uniref:Uncharacterized protein n=1 Tax=Trichoglossum hirsutum TaxID=265104 RepID=A0A9P8LJ52_9PEZI|nr:hypothetical protein GP486_000318 [Trichoglossum hirsutum]